MIPLLESTHTHTHTRKKCLHFRVSLLKWTRLTDNLNAASSLFVLSQCLPCSPTWLFCSTWMTSSKGPISLTEEKRRMEPNDTVNKWLYCETCLHTAWCCILSFHFHGQHILILEFYRIACVFLFHPHQDICMFLSMRSMTTIPRNQKLNRKISREERYMSGGGGGGGGGGI